MDEGGSEGDNRFERFRRWWSGRSSGKRLALVLSPVAALSLVVAFVVPELSGSSGNGATSALTVDTLNTPTTGVPEDPPASLPGLSDRDAWGDLKGGPPLLPPNKQLLIDGLGDPHSCPPADAEPALMPTQGQKLMLVIGVANGCLTSTHVVVSEVEIESRIAAEIAKPDVVGADVATVASTAGASLPKAGNSFDTQQWWLNDLKVAELDSLSWDPDAPPVQVAVIDSGVDDSASHLHGLVAKRWSSNWAMVDPHGTHIAGIIATNDKGGTQGRGVSLHTQLIDVLGAAGPGEYLPVAQAIIWAVDQGAQIISMSIVERDPVSGTMISIPNRATAAAVAYARHQHVLLIAAVGNCGPSNYKTQEECGHKLIKERAKNRFAWPASYPSVLGVTSYNGGANGNGTVSGFSSQNGSVDVAAPGDPITSTGFSGKALEMFGTSQASAMVAGAAAAILAHRPDVDPLRVLNGFLVDTRGDPCSNGPTRLAPCGWNAAYGNGKIDPVAVAARIDRETPLPTVNSLDFLNATLPAHVCDTSSVSNPFPIYLNNGTGVSGDLTNGTFSSAEVVGAPMLADINGDGRTDAVLNVSCNWGGGSAASFSNAVVPLTLYGRSLHLLGGKSLWAVSDLFSTIDSAELNGTDIVAAERYATGNEKGYTPQFYTSVASVSWRWNGTEFIPTVTKAPPAQACNASAIAASNIGTIFYSGPVCAGDWAIGTVIDLAGADLDPQFVVGSEVFHFIDGVWHDVGEFYTNGNCAASLITSGMSRNIAKQLAPDDYCLPPPINTFVAEPSTGPLRRGDQGERVKRLQTALRGGLIADGQFGVATEIAIKDLQTRLSLERDGIAGPATFAALGLAYP